MIRTALSSGRRFFAGKMFNENRIMLRQFSIGVGTGAATVVVIAHVAPPWLASIVGGAVSGFLQPLLFKHLKFA